MKRAARVERMPCSFTEFGAVSPSLGSAFDSGKLEWRSLSAAEGVWYLMRHTYHEPRGGAGTT